MNVAKYVGRSLGVRVPDLGDVWVERGQDVEVEDTELFHSLLEQEANWQYVRGSKPKPPPQVETQEPDPEPDESTSDDDEEDEDE